ncbi:MAG: hypothetical protein ACR2JB_23770 [Bryobacteraceae bacterium]
MSNLKQRVEKLEKAGGGVSSFDERFRKFCANAGMTHSAEIPEALRGHEAEIHISEDGLMTFEQFRVLARYLGVEGA